MQQALSSRLVWLLIAIVQLANASSFKPECTISPPGTNYVSGPNTRGTTSILFNCLSIIFLCTWNIQHLNVPAARPQAKSIIQSIWRVILDSRTKTKWMIFTILVPEYLIGKAFGERLAAKAGVKRMKELDSKWDGFSDAVQSLQWEDIHVYMANMGHFVVDFSDVLDDHQALNTFQALAHDVRTRPSCKHQSTIFNLNRLLHRTWALNNSQLRCAFEEGLIDMPDVSTRQLARLDRGDKLVKAFALLQILYLVMQLLARRVASLPSTQLEIATLAFALSSIITYILYWSRPQGVESVHIIRTKKIPDAYIFERIAIFGSHHLGSYGRTEGRLDTELDLVPLPNDSRNIFFDKVEDREQDLPPKWIHVAFGGNQEVLPLAFGAVVGGTLFGGLHCLAWNFQFPTLEEALAWKICSVLTTSLPIFAIVPFIAWTRLTPRPGSIFAVLHRPRYGAPVAKFLVGLVLIILLITYILARLFLMVESFRSLFFLPPKAFIETWSGSFPHFTG